MSAVELMEWIALQAIEPLYDPLWGCARICATIINMNRAKGAKVVSPEDVIPILRGPPRSKQNGDQIAKALEEWLD